MSDNKTTDTKNEIGNEALASALDITVEELEQLDWTVDGDMSGDILIYKIIVTFSADSPKEILNKIEGLDKDNQVRLSPSALSPS